MAQERRGEWQREADAAKTEREGERDTHTQRNRAMEIKTHTQTCRKVQRQNERLAHKDTGTCKRSSSSDIE